MKMNKIAEFITKINEEMWHMWH